MTAGARRRADRLWFVVVAVAVFALDRATKLAIQATLARGESVEVVPGVLQLQHVHNTGIAFGLFADAGWIIVALTVVVAVVLLVTMLQLEPDDRASRVAGAVVLGGALGNVADRLWFGHVVDFLELPRWPTFNVADMAIVGGVAVLVVQQWRGAVRERSEERDADRG